MQIVPHVLENNFNILLYNLILPSFGLYNYNFCEVEISCI